MPRTVSATEARIHFGELIQEAQKEPVFVERSGEPVVVILSKDSYDALLRRTERVSYREQLKEVHRRVREDLGERMLPPADEMIRQGREEHDEPYDHLH